jgi:hypothetical protein
VEKKWSYNRNKQSGEEFGESVSRAFDTGSNLLLTMAMVKGFGTGGTKAAEAAETNAAEELEAEAAETNAMANAERWQKLREEEEKRRLEGLL